MLFGMYTTVSSIQLGIALDVIQFMEFVSTAAHVLVLQLAQI